MGKMRYDQETRDLAQLASRRVSDAMVSVVQLCDGPDQAMQVAMMAAGTALGSASGAIAAKYGCTHDEAERILCDLLLPSAGRAALSSEQKGRQ